MSLLRKCLYLRQLNVYFRTSWGRCVRSINTLVFVVANFIELRSAVHTEYSLDLGFYKRGIMRGNAE